MKERISILAALLLQTIGVSAQYDQTIISVGDRELTVDQAFKIGDLPGTIDTVYTSRELDYQLVPRQVEVAYDPKPISAAKLKVIEPLSKLYRGYAKVGIGVYVTPLLDIHFNSIRNRDWAYGIDAKHFSSHGGLKDVGNNAYAENHFGGWARRYVGKHTVEGGLGYDMDRIHYYGFDPGDIDIDSKDYRQAYNTIKGYVELKSHYSDSTKVQHTAYLKVRNTKADIDASETGVIIGGLAAKTIEDYRFALGVELDVNSFNLGRVKPFTISATQDSEEFEFEESKGSIFRLNPSIHAQKKDLTADIGLGIAVDTGEDKTKLHLYPQAYLSYSLFDDLFTPYAGITGNLKRNSYHSLVQENPFVLNAIGLVNTSKDLEVYGGIRGTIFDNLAFNARVSLEKYDNHQFYLNDTIYSVENKFQVVYDDLRVLRLAGELTYKHDEHLTIGGRLELASNTADKLERAFNLPGVKFTLDGRYDLDDTFVVKAQIFAAGKRYGFTMQPGENDEVVAGNYYEAELRGYVDASFGLEYRYTKRISAFFDVNNLTGGRYERWYKYKVQPVLIMGGLTYSF